MNEILMPRARLYAAAHQLELAETLGSGKDGIILVGKNKNKPAEVAIKILYLEDAYWREKQVYLRLGKAAVTNVLGFNIPQLVDSDDGFLTIQMTIVKRPFVLDFAGARLDVRPDFSEEVWVDWENEKREQFENRWETVQDVIAAFERLGIYLLDVSPGNIGFLEDAGA